VKVAAIQMNSGADVGRNLELAAQLLGDAALDGCALAVLPENFALMPERGRDKSLHAERPGEGPIQDFLRETAVQHGMWIIGGSMPLESPEPERVYGACIVVDHRGDTRAIYRKIHLFPPLGEVEHMAPGGEMPTFDLPWGRTALAICYDLRFPEQWRRYLDAGAQLILIPAEWPLRRVEHWRLLLRARAVENQFFVAACNRAGTDADGEFGGHSAVIDPWDRVVVEGGSEPGLFFATLDLGEVTRVRHLFPFLNDRRPELYS